MKKYLFVLFTILLFLFLPCPVYADEIEVLEMVAHKSDDSIQLKEEYGYNFSVLFSEEGQKLTYDVTIVNTTTVDMTIHEITISNPRTNHLDYSYSGIRNGEVIKAGSEKKFRLDINAVGEIDSSIDDNFVFNINYDRDEIPDIYTDIINPQTGVLFILLILGLTAGGFLLYSNIHYRKNKIGLFFIFFLLCFSFITIKNVYALNVNFSIRGHVSYKSRFDVSIDLGGGSLGSETGTCSFNVIDGETINLRRLAREYYQVGYLIINGERVPFQDEITVTSDMEIIVVWDKIMFNVTVNPNGGYYLGTTGTRSYQVEAGSYFFIDDVTRAGYHFRSWQVNPSNVSIQNNTIFVNQNITIKALWDEVYYTLTIDPNGGVYNGSTQEYVTSYRYNEVVPLQIPTKEGANFAYWELEDGTQYTGEVITMDDDYTLKAIFDDLYFHVRLDLNGGTYQEYTGVYEEDLRYGTTLHLNSVTREDYILDGWLDENDQLVSYDTIILRDDLDLTAQWGIPVCRIGEVQYSSLGRALSAASSGDVITLLSDVTEDFTNTKNITLDLNAYTLYGHLTNNSTLTIINGTVLNEEGTAITNNGSLTLGTNDGNVSTTSVVVSGSDKGIVQNGNFYYYDGSIYGNVALVGGYQGVPENYYVVVEHDDDIQYMSLTNDNTNALVKTTAGGDIYYTDVQDSINTSSYTGYTIYAIKNFIYSSGITIPSNKTIPFDISGYTTTIEGDITNNGTFQLTDSTYQTGEFKVKRMIQNNGTFRATNVKVSQNTSADLINNKGSLVLNNSILQSLTGVTLRNTTSGSSFSFDSNSYIKSNGGTAFYNTLSGVAINGGHIESTYRAIHNDGGSITFNSGEVKANSGSSSNVYGVYNENGATFTIAGGSVIATNNSDSAYGIYNDSETSKVNMSSGTIQVTGSSNGYGIYGGTNVLTGGSLTSNGYGIYNGNSTLGVNNTTLNTTSPSIVGELYGTYEGRVYFYDGVIKGRTAAYTPRTIKSTPEGYVARSKVEDGYNVAYLLESLEYFEVDEVGYITFEEAYNAIVGNTGTIKVLRSNSYTSSITIPSEKNITLDLNGCTFTISPITNNGTLTIIDSTETDTGTLYTSNTSNATITNNGTLNVESGTVSSTYRAITNSSGKTFNLSGGTIKLDTTSYSDYNAVSNGGTINMTGGTIYARKNYSSSYSYYYVYGVINNSNGVFNMDGGTITVNSVRNSGYGIYNNSSSRVNITSGSINVTAYYNSYGIYNSSSSVSITMSGGTITGSYGIYNSYNCTITMTGGTITASSSGIYNGTVLLGTNDGNLNNTTPSITGASYGISSGNLTMYDGIIKGKSGAYYSLNSLSIADNAGIYYNYENPYYVFYLVDAVNLFEVDQVSYSSFESAYNAISGTSGTIKVIGNGSTLPKNIGSGKTITLDLNGHNVSFASTLINSGNLTILDSSQQQNGVLSSIIRSESVILNSGGTLNVQSGTISSPYMALRQTSSGVINITGGKIKVTDTTLSSIYGIYNERGSINFTGGELVVSSGSNASTNSSNTSYGIYNYNSSYSNVITIDGGTITMNENHYTAYGVYDRNSSTVSKFISGQINMSGYGPLYGFSGGANTISGGTVQVATTTNGAYGVSGGTNTITGGTIRASHSGSSSGIGLYNGTNVITDGEIYGSSYGMSGGTYTLGSDDNSINTSKPVIIGDINGIGTSNVNFYDGIIKGKTNGYSSGSIKLSPEGTIIYCGRQGEYEVCYLQESGDYLEVNGVSYNSLTQAYQAISGDTGTIKVINSITTSEPLPTFASGKTITFDLNGKTLNYTQSLVNEGTLNIVDYSNSGNGILSNISNTKSTIINKGVLNANSGTIFGSYRVIENSYSGTVNLINSSLIAEASVSDAVYGVYNVNGTVNFNGGTITIRALNNSYKTIYGIYNTDNVDNIVNVNGGVISASEVLNTYIYGIYSSSNSPKVNFVSGQINISGYYNSYGIAGGTNTISDGSIQVTSIGNTAYGLYNGVFHILGGSISASTYGSYSSNVYMGTKDGNVSTSSPILSGDLYGFYSGKLYYYDGILKGKTSSYYSSSITLNIEEGYTINTETIDSYKVSTLVINNDNNYYFEVDGVSYRNFSEAYRSITGNSGTIKAIQNVDTIGDPVAISEGKIITLDLNGKTLRYNTSVVNEGTLTIVDSTTSQAGILESKVTEVPAVENRGTFYLQSGTLKNTNYGIRNAGTVEMTGGTIKVQSSSNYLYGIYNNSGVVSLNGGEILVNHTNYSYSASYAAYGVYNTNSSNNVVNLNGGTITVNDPYAGYAYGIYNASNSSKTNMSSGTITSKGYYATYGIYYGTNTISGGTINSTGNYQSGYGLYSGINVITGGSINGSSYGIYDSTLVLGTDDGVISTESPIITGGSYGLYYGSVKFYDGRIRGQTSSMSSVSFTTIAYGYKRTTTTIDGYSTTYLVEEPRNYEVDNQQYVSYADAYNAITGDIGTIKVIREFTDNNTLPAVAAGKNITIDLNGYNLTFNRGITNNGTLTIMDSSSDANGKLSTGSYTSVDNNGILNITSGTVYSTYRVVINNSGGTLNISGGTINLTSTSYDTYYAVYNNGTINMTGGTVYAKKNYSTVSGSYYIYGIYNRSGSLNIEGGTVDVSSSNNSAYAICNYYSSNTINMSGGSISVSAYYYSYGIYQGNIIMSGGTIQSTTSYSNNYSFGIYNASSASVTEGSITAKGYGIYGTTTTLGSDDFNVQSVPVITGDLYGIYSGNFKFYDGIIKGKTAPYLEDNLQEMASGAILVRETIDSYDTAYLIEDDTNYFEVDGTYYNSYKSAYQAVTGDTGTITVLADVNTYNNYPEIDSGKTITLDLNGYTMSSKKTLTNNGTLIIKDSSNDKTGNFVNNNTNSGTYAIINKGSLTIQSGTVTGYNRAISNNSNSTLTLGGGVITASNFSSNIYLVYNYGNLTINSGEIRLSSESESYSNTYGIYNSNGQIVMTGGKIYLHVLSTANAYGIYNNGSVNISNGEIDINNTGNANGIYMGTVTMSGGSIKALATESYSGYGFRDLTSTITGGVIEGSSYGILYGTTTLGVDDGTISSTSPVVIGGFYGIENGTLYIYDGIFKGKTGDYSSISLTRAAHSDVHRETIDGYKCYYLTETPRAFEVGENQFYTYSEALASIEGNTGTIKQLIDYTYSGTLPSIDADKTITLDLNGHTFSNNNSITNNGTFIIEDNSDEGTGTFKFTNSGSIAFINNGTLSFSGGTITTLYRMVTNNTGATLNISGGTFNISYSNTADFHGIYNYGTVHITGGDINVSKTSTYSTYYYYAIGIYNSNGIINMDGGAITSTANYQSAYGIVNYSNGSQFNMTDGTINVNAYYYTYGVSSGINTISGGTIQVQNNSSSYGGYGISSGTNTISGGTIQVTSIGYSYGIESGTNTITGGSITASSTSSSGYGLYNGTSVITAGTIIGSSYGINYGTYTLGENDGVISSSTPFVQGELYGVCNGTFKFYDGTVKGKTNGYISINDRAPNSVFDYQYVDGYHIYSLKNGEDLYGVGNDTYNTMSEAYNAIVAAGTEGEIKVIDSFYSFETLPTIASGIHITIDMNGNAAYYSNMLTNNGNLDFKDTSQSQSGIMGRLSTSDAFVRNNSGATIYLYSGTIYSYYRAVFNYYGTFHLSGGNILLNSNSSSEWHGIYNNRGTVNINSGTITLNRSGTNSYNNIGIYNTNNTNSIVNMYGGKIEVYNTSNVSYGIYGDGTNFKVNISGGEIIANSSGTGTGIYSGTNVITSGTIKGSSYGINYGITTMGTNDTTVSTTSPVVQGDRYGIYNGTLNFYDGVLKGKTSAYHDQVNRIIPNGYMYHHETIDEYDVCTLSESSEFLVVDNVGYNTFTDAYSAAIDSNSDGIIHVVQSIETSMPLFTVESGKTIVLDLHDNSVIVSSNITNNGTLTIQDSGYNHSGILHANNVTGNFITNNSVLNILSGTISSNYRTIYNNNASNAVATIDGVVKVQSDTVAKIYAIYNYRGKVFVNATGKIIVNQPSESTHSSSYYAYGIYNENNANCQVTLNSGSSVSVNGENYYAYGIYNGGNNAKVTIDSATITVNAYNVACGLYYGTNVIYDGTISVTSSSNVAYGTNYGVNTITRGTITATSTSSNSYSMYYGTNTVTNASLISTSTSGNAFCVYYGSGTLDSITATATSTTNTGYGIYNGTYTMPYGTITSSGYGVYETNLTLGTNDSTIVTSSPVIQGDLYGMYSGTLNFYDGVIKGKTKAVHSSTNINSLNGTKNVYEVIDGYENYYLEFTDRYLEVNGDYYDSFVDAYGAITGDTGTIKVVEDISTSSAMPTIESGKTITLDLNGKTIDVSNTIVNNGTLNIVDNSENHDGIMTLTTTKELIYNKGTLNIQSGILSSIAKVITNSLATSVINMTGGTLYLRSSLLATYGINNTAGVVNFTGGTITKGANESGRATGYSTYGIYSANTTGNVITIDGGSIEIDSIDGYVYGVNHEGTNSKLNYLSGDINVKSSSVSYGIYNGTNLVKGSITSISTDNSAVGISRGTNTLNQVSMILTGYQSFGIEQGTNTITDSSITSTASYTSYGLYQGTNTVTNSTITASVSNPNYAGRSYGTYDGTNTIKSGTISGNYGIYNGTHTLGISDSTVNTNNPVIIGNAYGVYNGSITFLDGVLKGKSNYASTTINGYADGYTLKTETVDGYQIAYLVAQTNTKYYEYSGTQYYSFSDAYNAITGESGTIKIIGVPSTNVDIGTTIESGKSITIDLNGKNFNKLYSSIVNLGTLTIIDSSQEQSGILSGNVLERATIINRGTFYLESGTISSMKYAITSNSGGTVHIDGGKVQVQGTTNYLYGIYNNNSSVYLSGGEVYVKHTNNPQNTSYYAYGVYNTDNQNNTVVVDGGKINVDDLYGGFCMAIYTYNNYLNTNTYVISGEIIAKGYGNTYIFYRGTNHVSGGNLSVQSYSKYTFAFFKSINEMSGGTVTVTGPSSTSYRATAFDADGENLSSTFSGGTINVSSSGCYTYGFYDGSKVMTGGTINVTASSVARAYGNRYGSFEMSGGTINSSGYGSVDSNLILGSDDGDVATDYPIIVGSNNYGVSNGSSYRFEYYDGVIKGKSNPVNGTIHVVPQGYQTVTETIDNLKVMHLEASS